jgi:polyphenol oxidase
MLHPVVCPSLSAFPAIRHAWFTREGGVSAGPLYGSLNGGLGSQDERAHVVENRARMAAHLGVSAERMLSVWQVLQSASRQLTAARCCSPIPQRV